MPTVTIDRGNLRPALHADDAAAPPRYQQSVIKVDPDDADAWPLRHFLNEKSKRDPIKLCGRGGIKYCHSWLCEMPTCGPTRRRGYRGHLNAALRAARPQTAIELTVTVPSTPGSPLGAVWADLRTVLKYLAEGGWLTRNVGGYACAQEVTLSPRGWHPHAHFLLVSRKRLDEDQANALGERVMARLADAAAARGIVMEPRAQHFAVLADSEALAKWVLYITKDQLKPDDEPGTLSAGDIMREAAAKDPRALALYGELEAADTCRRLWSVAGILRPPKAD